MKKPVISVAILILILYLHSFVFAQKKKNLKKYFDAIKKVDFEYDDDCEIYEYIRMIIYDQVVRSQIYDLNLSWYLKVKIERFYKIYPN